ncbi:beta-ketoacyl-[acyl-carrier-protein] synthase family protein [Thiolapillus brandeum]|uniref:3-oxoacyl-[acyl-carrier-protein] synthase I n=1 Tax=Thiolapillus brandeum TaxID=1076588 RepID=A0A7U6GI24_9GAMM|nr:beta-ketoacyl-[acyl-carrier-protein] synthase family protein [Thiolapillus brandeum]BAO44044.1 3-oxoacyl-[acyl-carrier-protein] synthase I [Thiolapillus brandeum]
MKRALQLTAYTLTSALGQGLQAQMEALYSGRSGLRPCDLEDVDLSTWIGRVPEVEEVSLPEALQEYHCRNHQLAWLGLNQDDFPVAVAEAAEKYGAHRVGVFMGTSTSGVQQMERAYEESVDGQHLANFNYRTTQNIFSLGDFVSRSLGLNGPVQVISTACSSSAKVFAAAYRHMQAGFCDCAVVGGVDSLCKMTLYGFNALQLVSSQPCRPADAERDGLSIGEAAGFALLEWQKPQHRGVSLIGYGESADAYHMSSPHPDGLGAAMSMGQALASAGLKKSDIHYVNLHGTATPANDLSEDKAMMRLFGDELPCSSTKGFTGHTLGAAGIVEALFSAQVLQHQYLPPSAQTRSVDPRINSNILLDGRERQVRRVMSNSFGFGGSNISLVFGSGQ